MEKAISTSFMVIVSILVSVMVFNAIYPAVQRSTESLVSMRGRMDERLKTQIEVVHAAGELDSGGAWQDANSDGDFNVHVWVKNLGSMRIASVDTVDVFFGPEGNFTRIGRQGETGGSYPFWEWQIENDTDWNPRATVRISVHYGSALSSGRYFVKIVVPSGLSTSDYVGL